MGRLILLLAAGFTCYQWPERFVAALQPGSVSDGATRIVVINRFDTPITGVLAAWAMNSCPKIWKRLAPVLAVAGVLLAIGMYATLCRPEGDFVTSAHESLFGKNLRFNLLSLVRVDAPAASLWKRCPANIMAAGVQNVARRSFSLYLVHGPVIFFVQTYTFVQLRTSPIGAGLSFMSQLVISLLVSALLFAAFERPFMRLRRRAGPAVARGVRGRDARRPSLCLFPLQLIAQCTHAPDRIKACYRLRRISAGWRPIGGTLTEGVSLPASARRRCGEDHSCG